MFELLLVFLLTVTEVMSSSLTECFYEIGTIRGVTYLGSMFCQYGCCGTSQNQRCCSREEKYPDEDEGRTWRIVALAFAGVIIVLALSLVACWVLKKKNRKVVRVRASNYPVSHSRSQNTHSSQAADVFAITLQETARNMQPPAYTYLPKYSEAVYGNGTGTTSNGTSGHTDGHGAGGSGFVDRTENTAATADEPMPQTERTRPTSPPPSYAP